MFRYTGVAPRLPPSIYVVSHTRDGDSQVTFTRVGKGVRSAGALAVVFALLLLCASVAHSAGDPADFDTDCFREQKPCGDPVVLHEATLFDGPLEIIGYSSRFGPCLVFDHKREGSQSTTCGPPSRVGNKRAIAMQGLTVLGRKNARLTDVNGYANPATASAQIQFERGGETRTRGMTVVQVQGELQEQLRLARPVSMFFGTMRGCVPARSMRFTAFDAGGDQLGRSERAVNFGCGVFKHGGGGIILGPRKDSLQRIAPR